MYVGDDTDTDDTIGDNVCKNRLHEINGCARTGVCSDSCENIVNPPAEPLICSDVCAGECVCQPHYARNSKGRCVRFKKCRHILYNNLAIDLCEILFFYC